MRTFLLALVAVVLVAVVLLIWTGAAWQAAEARARDDASRRIQDITAALREAAADGTLTAEEVQRAGVYDNGTRENDRHVVTAIVGGHAHWWSPMAYGNSTSEKSASWLIEGARVEII